MWLIFLILHLVGLVGYNLLLRKSLLAKVDKLTLATVMQTSIALPMVIMLFIYPINLSDFSIAYFTQIIITTALVILLHLTNVKALDLLQAGTYSLLYDLRIILTTFLGIIFLNEQIIPLQIFGGLLIFMGVLTLRQKGRSAIPSKGLQWGLAASVVISFLNMFEKKLINENGYLEYAIPVMITAAVIMWIFLICSRRKIKLSYFKEPKTIQLMTLRAMSAYGFTLAFNAGAVISVATYISSLSVIIIVLLGIWLLNERDHIKQKMTATALAAAGLTAIFIPNYIG